jgi:hypothetical protein
MGKPKDGEAPAKLLSAFLPKAEDSGAFWWRLPFRGPCTIRPTPRRFFAMPAQVYKVDVDAIFATIKEVRGEGEGKDRQESHTEIGTEAHEESSA